MKYFMFVCAVLAMQFSSLASAVASETLYFSTAQENAYSTDNQMEQILAPNCKAGSCMIMFGGATADTFVVGSCGNGLYQFGPGCKCGVNSIPESYTGIRVFNQNCAY